MGREKIIRITKHERHKLLGYKGYRTIKENTPLKEIEGFSEGAVVPP